MASIQGDFLHSALVHDRADRDRILFDYGRRGSDLNGFRGGRYVQFEILAYGAADFEREAAGDHGLHTRGFGLDAIGSHRQRSHLVESRGIGLGGSLLTRGLIANRHGSIRQ